MRQFSVAQDIFNLLPNLDLETFVQSLTVKTNDQTMVVYLASLLRTTISLHSLINNKVGWKFGAAAEAVA